MLPPLSLYVHIPWCIQKCPYCDFNSHAIKETLPETSYVKALLEDLRCDVERFEIDRKIQSIFIGGGTPSLFSVASIATLLEGISRQLNLAENVEITLEANPGTFESAKFKAIREAGVNRLSIGIQSFDNTHLKSLGRIHDSAEAIRAAEIARCAGFDNFNLDLMFALPEQGIEQALNDVRTAIELSPSHISFYQLTLEPNTYFHHHPPPLPEDELVFAMQRACQQLLAEHGFWQYEISAYAREGSQCRHNLNYWRFGDYLGIGAGAHGKISRSLPNAIYRTTKTRNPGQYLEKAQASSQPISMAELPLEFLMNHLRLRQGFTATAYEAATGQPLNKLEPSLSKAIEEKLLTRHRQHYQCSEQGWNFLDSLLEKFIQ